VQQLLYFTLFLENAHTDDHVAELSLVHNAIHVEVESFVVLVEFMQKFFVLSELKVKNHLFEIFVHQFLVSICICSFDSCQSFSVSCNRTCVLITVVDHYIANLLGQLIGIMLFIHFLEDLLPYPIFNQAVLGRIQHS